MSIDITRDAGGAITSAKMNFLGAVNFPGSVNIVGLHIHEGDVRSNGPVRFDRGISSGNPITFSGGSGTIVREVATVNLDVLRRLLDNPTGFYPGSN